jgi:hypothetical protein
MDIIDNLISKYQESKILETEYDIIVCSIQINMIEKGTITKDIKLRNLGISNLEFITDKLVDLNAVIEFLKIELKNHIKDDTRLQYIIEKEVVLDGLNDSEKEEIVVRTNKDVALLKKEKEQLNISMFKMLCDKDFQQFLNKKKDFEYINWLINNLEIKN